MHRPTSLIFDELGEPLEVRAFRIETALSQPTRVELTCVAPDPDLDLESLLGVHASFTLGMPADGHLTVAMRLVCDRAEQVRTEPAGLTTYRVGLTHPIALLGLQRGYRVHQRKSVIGVVGDVLGGHGIPFRLELAESAYPKLEYCVQYDETDLAYLERILARAGVVFVCESDAARASVVLTDDPGRTGLRAQDLLFSESETDRRESRWAGRLARSARLRPSSVMLAPRDDLHPRLDLAATSSVRSPGGLHYVHRATAGLTSVDESSTPTPVADAKGTARHDLEWTQTLAKRRLEALRSDARGIDLETHCVEVVAGCVLTVHGHPRRDVSEHPLLVRRAVSEGELVGEWRHMVELVFADAPYRGLPRAPEPRAFSVEMATVTGPPGETIHVDEHGRVRVRFHWDRFGATDDDSSCWLHVSQAWAGPSYGIFSVPRVGNEVLVAFVGGDPDHPIVVGRVHQGAAPPPFHLPEEKTKTGIRTQVPGGGGFNELSFDDATGAERVFLRAERDHEILVQRDRTARVQHDDATVVERDQSLRVHGTQETHVTGDRTIVMDASDDERLRGSRNSAVDGDVRTDIGKSRVTRVGGDDYLTVHGDSIRKVVGCAASLVGSHEAPTAATLVVEGSASLETSDVIDVTSEKEIILRVGSSFLHVTPTEIILSSPKVTLLGKDARVELDEGAARTKVKTSFQVVSDDAVVFKSSAASIALKDEVKVDGVKILLNSPEDAKDEIQVEEREPTQIELVDQDGAPLANQLYRIELESGRTLMGFLDHEGKATVYVEEGGSITFPELGTVQSL